MTTVKKAGATNRSRSERKRTPTMLAMICKLVRKGLSIYRAAEVVRVHHTTVQRWRQDYPNFDADVRAAEAQFIEEQTANVREAGKKSWQASMTLLERRFPSEFGQPQVQVSLGLGKVEFEELSVTIDKARKDPQLMKDLEEIRALGVAKWMLLQEAQRNEKLVEGREIKQIEDA